MVLDTEAPAVFGVSVTNGEFFRELSIFDEMFLMRCVPRINREPRIARPFAGLVGPVTWDATGTAQIHPDAGNRRDSEKEKEKPQPEPSCHPSTLSVAGPHERKRIGNIRTQLAEIVPGSRRGRV